MPDTERIMGKGKHKSAKDGSGGSGGASERKALRTAVDEAVNEAVKIQVCP